MHTLPSIQTVQAAIRWY